MLIRQAFFILLELAYCVTDGESPDFYHFIAVVHGLAFFKTKFASKSLSELSPEVLRFHIFDIEPPSVADMPLPV